MASLGARDTVPAMIQKTGDQREFDGVTASHTEGVGLAEEAKNASDSEHKMTLARAIKLYPRAIGWSVLLSSTLIMEGTSQGRLQTATLSTNPFLVTPNRL